VDDPEANKEGGAAKPGDNAPNGGRLKRTGPVIFALTTFLLATSSPRDFKTLSGSIGLINWSHSNITFLT
jgi:hypothetical protein